MSTRDSFPAADPVSARDSFTEQRSPYFTASNAAVLYGKHPFVSAADYWIEKFNGTQVDETDEMIRGQELEPAIASWFARQHGWKIQKATRIYTCGVLAATPDYLTIDGPERVIEIKSTAKRDLDEAIPYWVYQVQMQLHVMDIDHGVIVWIDGNLELHSQEVDRDTDLGEDMERKAERFMESVDSGVIPDWVEAEARHIIARYPDPDENAVEAGDRASALVKEYLDHKDAAKYHDEQAAHARDAMFELAGNHSAISSDGHVIATLKPVKMSARLDKKKVEQFAAEQGVHINAFMSEPTTTRRLNIPAKVRKAYQS